MPRTVVPGFWCMSEYSDVCTSAHILASNNNAWDLFRRSRRAPCVAILGRAQPTGAVPRAPDGDRVHRRAQFPGFWCMSLSIRMSVHQLILASNDSSWDLFRRSRRTPCVAILGRARPTGGGTGGPGAVPPVPLGSAAWNAANSFGYSASVTLRTRVSMSFRYGPYCKRWSRDRIDRHVADHHVANYKYYYYFSALIVLY